MARRVSFRPAGIACASALMFCLITSSGHAAAVSCGDVVTADIVVENDLVGCAGNGLVISASDVVVDLNGHTVSGLGSGTGILVAAPEDVVISNIEITDGTVRGFATGIDFEGDQRGAIRGVRVHGMNISRNASGIAIFTFANDVELRDNRIARNSGHGIQTGDDTWPVDIVGNDILRNGGQGIRVREDSVRLVSDNVVAHNGGTGVAITDSVSTITGNTLLRNGGDGLSIFERVPSFLPLYVVSDNVANHNALGGMWAAADPPPPAGPAGSGNIAKHNGLFDCLLIVCASNRGHAEAPSDLEARLHQD